MITKLTKRIVWLLVLISITATLSAQSPHLPSYEQSRQRTILWTVLGVVGAGLAVFGFARTMNPPTADYDDPGGGVGMDRILFDSFLFGSGVGLTIAAFQYGPKHYQMMQRAPRPVTTTQTDPDPSDPEETDAVDEQKRDLRRVVERPYEDVEKAFADGVVSGESTDFLGTPLVFHAARNNSDTSVYRLFLYNHTPSDVLDLYGRNLLFYLLDRDAREEVEFLLERGVSPLNASDDGQTPLEHALAIREWDLMEPLLLYLLDTQELLVLDEVAAETQQEIWVWMLETPEARETAGRLVRNGVPLVVPEPDFSTRRGVLLSYTQDYLREAIANRFPVDVLLSFLEIGYYDLARVAMENHPLFQMIKAGYSAEEVRTFLDQGSSPAVPLPLPSRGPEGETILHALSETGENDTERFVPILIASGANPEARTSEGDTALMHAVRNDNVEYAVALLKAGARVATRGQHGSTALHIAARQSSDGSMIDLLLQYDADPTVRNEDGWQPLHVAAFWGNTVAAERLLDAGARIDAVTPRGIQPYHYSRGASTVQVFLDRGVDPHVTDATGSTILHIAMSRYPSPELISLLLDLGLDPNQRNDDGATPLFLATIFEHIDPRVGLLLLDAGADPSIENENGHTPWDMIEINESLRNTDFYWALNDLRYDEQ